MPPAVLEAAPPTRPRPGPGFGGNGRSPPFAPISSPQAGLGQNPDILHLVPPPAALQNPGWDTGTPGPPSHAHLQAASPQPSLWGCRAPPRLVHRTSARVGGGAANGGAAPPQAVSWWPQGWAVAGGPCPRRTPSVSPAASCASATASASVRPSIPVRVGAADSSAHGPPTAGAARGCIADPGAPADKSDAAVRCGCQHKEQPASSPPSPRR